MAGDSEIAGAGVEYVLEGAELEDFSAQCEDGECDYVWKSGDDL